MSSTVGRPEVERKRRRFLPVTRYRGMLVVVLWQVPVSPDIRPDGSIGFVIGGGLDRFFEINCDGSVRSAEPHMYSVVAVEGDYDLTSGVRLEAAASRVGSGSNWVKGDFAVAQLRLDTRYIGIGAGPAFLPMNDGADWSASLRLGRDERMHFRMDVNPPTALMPQQPARLGIGWNGTRRDLPSGFLGLAVLGNDLATVGVAGDAIAPLSRRTAIRVGAHAGSRDSHAVYGFVLGGRLLLP